MNLVVRYLAAGCVLTAATALSGCSGDPSVNAGLGVVAYGWGLGAAGSSAAASAPASTVPLPLVLPAGTTSVSAGRDGLLALAHGQVWRARAVGDTPGSLQSSGALVRVDVPGGAVTAISSGGQHSLALSRSGRVYAWGANGSGQLGDGTTTTRTTPVRVNTPAGARVSALAACEHLSVAATTRGRVYAWGSDARGGLGDGKRIDRLRPGRVALPDLHGAKIVQLVCGGGHVVARTDHGGVLTWGSNTFGQLGRASDRPAPAFVKLPHKAAQVAAGTEFSLAVLDNGSVYGWGANGDGELGNGTRRSTDAPTPVRFSRDVHAVNAADRYAVARTADDRLVAWGDNQFGQLGDGTHSDRLTPHDVRLPAKARVSAVATAPNGATVVVEPAPVKTVLVTPSTRAARPGAAVSVTAVAIDSRGRSLGPVDPSALHVRMAEGTCQAVVCTAKRRGLHEIGVAVAGSSGSADVFIGAGSPNADTPRFALAADSVHWVGWTVLIILLLAGVGFAWWSGRRRRSRSAG